MCFSGNPLLVGAAEAGCNEILTLLLQHGAIVDEGRVDGATPLFRAVARGHFETTRLLLNAGASPNTPDQSDCTPIMTAFVKRHQDIVDLLLKHDADVTWQDESGQTLLHLAVLYEDCAIAKHVLDLYPAGVDVQNGKHYTPIMLAAENGVVSLLELMLEFTQDPDISNMQEETALILSAKEGHLDCLATLVESGADMDLHDENGITTIIHIIQHPTLVARLLDLGASPNRSSVEYGVSPLLAATQGGFVDSVMWLLLGGADPQELSGEEQKCPLQVALYQNNLPLVQMLFRGSVCSLYDLFWVHEHVHQAKQAEGEQLGEVWTWVESALSERGSGPSCLQAICRSVIRRAVGCECLLSQLSLLPLPQSLICYVQCMELMNDTD